MSPAGIALGSNIGNRLENLRAARDRLREIHEGPEEAFLVSPIFETAPVGCGPDAAPFFNAAVELMTSLGPMALLDAAQAIERDLGRPSRRPKNAPRTIDVDLLYLGDQVVADPRLELPHPRLLLRRFVLMPLAAIRAEWRHPSGHGHLTIGESLAYLASDEPQPVLVRSDW
jgi:2-amino-4-hydroxy-6-hydroxymethyldihydropteridine diphosphokinase